MCMQRNDGGTAGCRRRRGFTMIELMAALAIIAILSAIAYPSYRESIRKGKRAEAQAALMQLMQQQERYYSHHNGYIAFSSVSTGEAEKKFKWFSGNSAVGSAYEISGSACPDDSIENCVLLTARPGTSRVDPGYTDPQCGTLTVDSTGAKGADSAHCWK